MKVNGITGNLTEAVAISKTSTSITVTVGSSTKFAKRYLKYLTKKFLKKNSIRDYLRVVAVSKTAYELRYFNLMNDNDSDAEDEE